MAKIFTIRKRGSWRAFGPAILLALSFCGSGLLLADETQQTNTADLVPLILKLPAPVFSGTPKAAPPETTVETAPSKPGPPLMIPKDACNVAPKSKISSSDKNATRAELSKITDGNKEADGEDIVLLHKGPQWLQFDLGGTHEVYAIAVWHAHDVAKIYRAVIVQVADDGDFTENVRTLFNNDRENITGLGAGTDHQYFETFRGKTMDAKRARARYVRLYSNGSTDSPLNEYTEVEIYGRPAK